MPAGFLLLSRCLRSFALVLATVLIFAPIGASAQSAQTEARTKLDSVKAEFSQIDATMQRKDLRDNALQGLRQRLDPLQEELREIIAREMPRLDGAKTRLDQLGPAPDPAKGPPESPDVTKERQEQEKLRNDIDDIIRLAKLMSVQGDQLQSAIGTRRRDIFTHELFERSSSILSPVLWIDVAKSLPGEMTALRYLAQDGWTNALNRLDITKLATLGGLVLLLIFGYLPLRNLIWRLDRRDADDIAPNKRRRATAALRIVLLRAAIAVVFAMAATNLLDVLSILTSGLQDIFNTLIWGIAVIFMIRGMAKAVLAPSAPHWRLFGDDEPSVEHLAHLAVVLPLVIIAGKVIDAINRVIVAPLPMTVLTKGMVAALVALLTLRALRLMQAQEDISATDEGREVILPAVPTKLPFRLLVGSAAFMVLAAALFGYISFAVFLTDQLVWIVCVGTMLAVLLVLIDEIVGRELSVDGKLGAFVRSTVGIKPGSLQQIGILSAGVLRLVLWVSTAFLVLAPWGIDSNDAFSTLRAAFFGFSIGGVTISLSSIAIAIGLFIVGFMLTRAIQGWLETQYLPSTGLDFGLRNSIKTILGYLGIFVASLIALSQLGLSLDKLTIVAGALSVGIGFGLQSIVNNFVSGLILLWERPIRVGDWIVVGGEQGIVKRINVRATEIETFDRASLIVPNAEFISGRVKNWMHNDHLGRIVIPMRVAYGADPEHVKKVLLDVALGHREVLSEPKPRVFFMELGSSTLDFELRCYADINGIATIKSELLFELFIKLKEAGISIPPPGGAIEIAEMDRLVEALAGKLTRNPAQ